MLFVELDDALDKEWLLLAAEEGGADANALLGRAHRVEWVHSNAVGHELAGQLKIVHAGILDSKIETIS